MWAQRLWKSAQLKSKNTFLTFLRFLWGSIMVNQKFSKLTGPQTKVMANLDEAVPDLATDEVPFLQAGVTKKVDIANLVDGMAGVADTTGLKDASGVLTVAAKIAHLEAALLKGCTTVPMSFESGEQTTTKIYFPMKVTINKIRGIVMKAVAGTDNGTVTCGNSTGASASGVITATASAALNTEYTVSPTTNNVVLADGYYYLTSAKITPGGKVLVSLEWTVTA